MRLAGMTNERVQFSFMSSYPKLPLNGWLNLYKPLGMTSNQALGALKRIIRPQKIGHAGTLDPLADGVLPIALGEATKTVAYMMDAVKRYQFTITFGESRSTEDAEGEVTATSDHRPTLMEIEAVLPEFVGYIEQTPPAFSAIKINGARAYDLARAGEQVEMKSRQVRVDGLSLLPSFLGEGGVGLASGAGDCSQPPPSLPLEGGGMQTITLIVTCGKGTYVRSLGRDIALRLGTVGYISRLTRLQVGAFDIANTISLDFLEKMVHNAPSFSADVLDDVLLPVSVALDDILAIPITQAQAARLKHGQNIAVSVAGNTEHVAAMMNGVLVAICRLHAGELSPSRVFHL